MVTLNREQNRLLEDMEAARATYDAKILRLEQEIAQAKDALKTPIKSLIAQAEAARIPTRRIHIALGFAQVNSLYAFLRPLGGSLLTAAETTTQTCAGVSITAPVFESLSPAFAPDYGNHEIEIESENPNGGSMWRVWVKSDTFGDAWERFMIVSMNEQREEAWARVPTEKSHGVHTDWPQVKAAIEQHVDEKFGKVIEWEETA